MLTNIHEHRFALFLKENCSTLTDSVPTNRRVTVFDQGTGTGFDTQFFLKELKLMLFSKNNGCSCFSNNSRTKEDRDLRISLFEREHSRA